MLAGSAVTRVAVAPTRSAWCLAVAQVSRRIQIVAVALLLSTAPAAAQGDRAATPIADFVKAVAFDPTTYAPASISYTAMRLDWGSSQPFFRNGYLESNPRFTVSGRSNDVAIDYGSGNRRILADALQNLGTSLVNNVANRMLERALVARYPKHKKLVRAIAWVERISFASYMSYQLSASQFQQWRVNEQLARQLGY